MRLTQCISFSFSCKLTDAQKPFKAHPPHIPKVIYYDSLDNRNSRIRGGVPTEKPKNASCFRLHLSFIL